MLKKREIDFDKNRQLINFIFYMTANNKIQEIKNQQTFCIIKPDGVKRNLTGQILSRLERTGLKIVALNMQLATKEQVREHYPVNDSAWVERIGDKGLSTFESLGLNPIEFLGTNDKKEIGEKVVESLIDYMTSGPVICLVVEGIQAVEVVRKLAGHTLPFKAETGTIRGDFSADSPAVANVEGRAIHNLFHASETVEEADKEIQLWFGKNIIDYKLAGEEVLYSKYY
jgi:nucleoside-diphosphate kinase